MGCLSPPPLAHPVSPEVHRIEKSLQVTLRQSLKHCQAASACSFKLQPFLGLLLCCPNQRISTFSALIQPLHTSLSPSSLTLSLACSAAGSPQLSTVAVPAHPSTLPPSSFSSISLCPTQSHDLGCCSNPFFKGDRCKVFRLQLCFTPLPVEIPLVTPSYSHWKSITPLDSHRTEQRS